MRKARSDAFWQKLSHQQMDELKRWLLDEGLSYGAAVDRLHQDWLVKTSETALSAFWDRFCAPLQFSRVAEAAQAAPALAESLENNFSAVSEAYVRQQYFALLSSRSPDLKMIALFAQQVASMDIAKLEREKLEFARQKHADTHSAKIAGLTLDREKFEWDAVDAAVKHAATIKTIATDKSLNSDARRDRMRQLLFPQIAKGVQPS